MKDTEHWNAREHVAWPRAAESRSADLDLNVLNNSYDRMHI